MQVRTQWMVVGGFAIALALVVAFGLAQPATDSSLGQPAPDFSAELLPTGRTVSLAKDYRGQVVLLNVWATWCGPCEAEMPEIQKLYEALRPLGLRVLAVSVDEEVDSDGVKKWADARHLTFDILHDPTLDIEKRYRTVGVPESFVIDAEGRVVKRVTGYVLKWDAPAQEALFRRLLSDAGQDSSHVTRHAPPQ